MGKKNDFVSVIIPTTGRPSLKKCKASLVKQTRPADEIIVINDQKRQGPAWARNEGIRKAKGNLVAFIDDDCIAPVDWLEKLVNAVQKNRSIVAGGTMNDTDPLLKDIRSYRRRNGKDETPGNTANIIFRKSCLDRCIKNDGYIFNELFRCYGSEDFELILRLKSNGDKILFINNPVTHYRKVSVLSYLRLTFRRGIGIAMLHEAKKLFAVNTIGQSSILWDKEMNILQKICILLVKKIFGPFDRRNFSKFSYFIIFWIGEKTQALGFIWGYFFHLPRLKRFFRKQNLI